MLHCLHAFYAIHLMGLTQPRNLIGSICSSHFFPKRERERTVFFFFERESETGISSVEREEEKGISSVERGRRGYFFRGERERWVFFPWIPKPKDNLNLLIVTKYISYSLLIRRIK